MCVYLSPSLPLSWIIQAMKNELKDIVNVNKLKVSYTTSRVYTAAAVIRSSLSLYIQLISADRRLEQLSPHQVKQLLIIALRDVDTRSRYTLYPDL